MEIKTRTMALGKAIDEVFLRFSLIALRIAQSVFSICVIGLAAALVDDFSNDNKLSTPAKASAALAVGCVCALVAILTILPIVWEGARFFTTLLILDLMFVAAWASLVGVWNCDATSVLAEFRTKYFQDLQPTRWMGTDFKLVKAMHAFFIMNIVLFALSAIVNLGLLSLELEHTRNWRSLPLVSAVCSRSCCSQQEEIQPRGCQCACHHGQTTQKG